MRVYAREFRVRRKQDDSPVTDADTAAHRIISSRLRSEYPGIPVLSEESAHVAPYESRRDWDSYWLVDPLDGTKEFVNRNGQFTVNIALIEGGRPVAGAVYAPARDWMYWGALESGAFKASGDGESAPIRCGPLPESGRLRVVGSHSHLSPETRSYVRALQSRYSEISFLAMGSSLKICLVAEGAADLYPRLAPTMEWDTAAAHAVLAAAGGRLVSYGTDAELRYNKEDLHNGWFIAEADRASSASPSRKVLRRRR
jgi:3'(2'), 5'-bisphosphate nucleotidase